LTDGTVGQSDETIMDLRKKKVMLEKMDEKKRGLAAFFFN